jgi:hypothetical protein
LTAGALGTRPARAALLAAAALCLAFISCAREARAASVEKIVFQEGDDIFRADADGTNVHRVVDGDPATDAAVKDPALSPDGQRIAYLNACSGWGCTSPREFMWVANADGSYPVRVFGCMCADMPANTRQGNVRWSPDGSHLLFDWAGSTYSGYDIWTRLPVKGGASTPVIRWQGAQREPVYSPDGARIAFTSETTPAGTAFRDGTHLFVVTADGTNPRDLGPGRSPDFSPDGTGIAFVRTGKKSTPQVHVMPAAGGPSAQLTRSGGSDPAWTPAGTHIAFGRGGDIFTVRPEGTDERRLIDGVSAARPAYRQPSAAMDFWDFVAAEFRPALRFDTSERWRPLNVSLFAEERDASGAPLHAVCSGDDGCGPLAALADLGRFPDGRVDVAGSGDETAYSSPYAACTAGGLRDCDSGRRSALYYRVAPDTGGAYRLVDYWWFYRLNDAPDVASSWFQHEGDWEGVTLAFPRSGQGTTFDWASFSQHGVWFRYLRSALSCDGGRPGSCGIETDRGGRALSVFVANNSHANYPERCAETVELRCRTTAIALYEGGHDGERPWGNNDDRTASLLELPPADPWGDGSGSWVTWPGRWGADEGSPESPGNQPHFKDPEAWSCGDAATCLAFSRARRPREARGCGAWFGGGVAGVACSPGRLRAALRRGRLRGRRGFALRRGRGGPGAGSAPGIAQVLGEPLRGREPLVLSGPAPAGTAVMARAAFGGRVFEAAFHGVRVRAGGRAVARFARRDGGVVASARLPGGRVRAGRVRRVDPARP